MRPTVLTAYRWEVRKLLSQKRTYIGVGAAALLPILFVSRDGPPDGRPLRRAARAQPAQDRARARAGRTHVRLALRRPARDRARRRRHRRERDLGRHAEDGLHALVAAQPDPRRQDARVLHLRAGAAARAARRRPDRRHHRLGLQHRSPTSPATSSPQGTRSGSASPPSVSSRSRCSRSPPSASSSRPSPATARPRSSAPSSTSSHRRPSAASSTQLAPSTTCSPTSSTPGTASSSRPPTGHRSSARSGSPRSSPPSRSPLAFAVFLRRDVAGD